MVRSTTNPRVAPPPVGYTDFAPGTATVPFDHAVDVSHASHGPVHVRNKSVFIQIDGLGYDAYQMAVQRGIVPDNVQRYFSEHGFQVQPYRVGQASTASSESGLLYGSNVGIPAEDSKTHRMISTVFPTVDVTQYLLDKQPGLLSEGSAYGMLIDGDAARSRFTGREISDFFTWPSKAVAHCKAS